MKLDLVAIGKWCQDHQSQLQLLTAVFGLGVIIYGLQVLMVERAAVPVCSAELLVQASETNFLAEQQLTVEVAGAVVEPGVWQFPVGSRVALAIEKAGGYSQRADRSFGAQGLNLARLLEDGEKIYVPFEGEIQARTDSSSALVEINSASLEELQTLPGIGAVRATEIIENRPYVTLEELVSKEVLTEAVYADLKEQVAL